MAHHLLVVGPAPWITLVVICRPLTPASPQTYTRAPTSPWRCAEKGGGIRDVCQVDGVPRVKEGGSTTATAVRRAGTAQLWINDRLQGKKGDRACAAAAPVACRGEAATVPLGEEGGQPPGTRPPLAPVRRVCPRGWRPSPGGRSRRRRRARPRGRPPSRPKARVATVVKWCRDLLRSGV